MGAEIIQPIIDPITSSCKVPGCKESHSRHYCGNCNDDNSSHFRRNCDSSQPQSRGRMHCKIPECEENHPSHYCRCCKDVNSNHFSHDCDEKNPEKPCPVKNCYEDHKKHFCKVCQDQNSNHLSSKCPIGLDLFHGTTEDCAKKILQTKFQPSKTGRIDGGIYFTPDMEVAKNLAKRTEKKTNFPPVVIRCKVCMNDKSYAKEGTHPIWLGVTTQPFKEVCVENDRWLRIVQVIQV